MDYEIYHDESKISGYWHGILLVPTQKKRELLCELEKVRENTHYYDPISLKNIKRSSGIIYNSASAWLHLGVWALMQKTKCRSFQIFKGKIEKGRKLYSVMDKIIGAKFILFRDLNDHTNLHGYSDYGAKIETGFRIGMKGGLHYLGTSTDKINVVKIHFDGYKHYNRHVSKERIIDRLAGLRDYCSFANLQNVIDDRSSDHRRSDSQPYEDCQLLQLADILVGSFRTILAESTREVHNKFVEPLKLLVDDYYKGYARMRNSRWFRGYCMSECKIEDGKWLFRQIEYQKNTNDQLALVLE